MAISRRAALAGSAALCLPRRLRAAEWSLRWGGNLPASHPLSRRIAEAASAIAQETGGRLQIACYPDNQLGGDTDMLVDVRAGTLDFMTVSGLILSRLVPEAAANGIGFAFGDYGQVWSAMDGLLGSWVRDAIAAAGLHALPRMFDNGFRQVTSFTRPVGEPADFRGLALRVPAGLPWTTLFAAFGAAPEVMDFVALPAALRSHRLDAQENALAVVDAARLYEAQRYCSMTGHMWDGFWFLANRATWERLPPDVQEVVERRLGEAALVQRAETRTLNDGLQGTLEQRGLAFTRPDLAPFRDVLRQAGFYDAWAGRLGPEGWGLLESTVGTLA